MFKNFSYLLIILFSSLINISFSENSIKLLEADAFDKVFQETIENNKKLFLIFFAKNCEYCIYSIKVLKENILPYYEENYDEISFGVVNLDRKTNMWIAYKFNITQIPFIILIENRKMYRFYDPFDEKHVIEFINSEKNVEDSLDIPEDIGFINKMNFFMANLIHKTSQFFQKFGISSDKSNILSLIVLGLCFLYFVYLEHKLLTFIRKIVVGFRNKKYNKNKEENEENKENKEDIIKEEKNNIDKNINKGEKNKEKID